ncbi:MAG: hypothetical protein M1830_008331 [Pleopsidium flavum]|nr:MAG: hypothetical protein M1830_008331 [Pleopsidium flavum]
MGWEERDRGTKVKKGKREEMLGGLKKDEAARLVRFVEESVDWNLAAARLSKLDIGGEAGGDGVVHGQLHTMCLEGRDMDSAAGTSHMTPCSEATTAESLKEHWRDILSKRIVDLYLE